MVTLEKEHVRGVVNTILGQLLQTTTPDVINSWGISSLYATQVVKRAKGYDYAMAALAMQVNGFQFQGKVFVALDEGADYYRIYGEQGRELKEFYSDIACDELGNTLDSMIETGGLSHQEYQEKVKDFICGL